MPQRVLIISNTIDAGGAETFVMKVFRKLDRKKIVFDFLINKKDSNFYLDEIEKLGGKVYYGVPKSVSPIQSFKSIYDCIRNNRYKIIFCIAVHPIGFWDLFAAKLAGAKRLLVRSTNSNAGGIISCFLAFLFRPLLRSIADVMYAPSKEAGIWLFGYKAVINNKVQLVNNGVDTNQFVYSLTKRETTRRILGLSEDTFVVGHIGRFNRQKNHKKILDVFVAIKKLRSNAVLLLVGDGENKKSIQKYAVSIGIIDSIRFLGIRTDISDLLCSFDVMVFPSFYEGMPNTIIEAQATDLPCVISDTISKDVKITDRISFLPLKADDKIWAKYAIDSVVAERTNNSYIIAAMGYDITETALNLSKYFEVIDL